MLAIALARLRVTLVPAPSTLTPLIATLVVPLSTAKRAVLAPGNATGSLKRTTSDVPPTKVLVTVGRVVSMRIGAVLALAGLALPARSSWRTATAPGP